MASKMLVLAALVAGASAFAPLQVPTSVSSTALFHGPVLGAGGMADTRDPAPLKHEDPRKSIGAAPSFEEYLKQRAGGGAPAPAAAAPAPAPAAYAPPAYAAPPAPKPAHSGPVIGAGGMADTRDPAPLKHEDPRKSIGAAPSFEEYLKQRQGGGAAPAAAAPAPAAYAPPVAAAPAYGAAPAVGGGGDLVGTLASLQGPGVVWGAEGIAVGKEESELKGYDGFSKFSAALQSTGVAGQLGAGPYTIFAPVNSALEAYEAMRGPLDANAVKLHIVPGKIASSAVSSADLTSLSGQKLKYRYAVRKHFVNDAIIGEKTFGPYPDYPVDVACSNGVIHAVGLCLAM